MTDTELTRKQCLEILAEAGYTGPTSYLMPKLRQIVAEVQAEAAANAKPKRSRKAAAK